MLSIVLPALSLAVLGMHVLRSGWLKARADEQADLEARAELVCELLRSGARIYGFDRHGPPRHRDDRMRMAPDDDAHGPMDGDGPPHVWKDWQIAVLPGICAEIERGNAAGADALAFAVSDSSHRLIYASANFPASPGLAGTCALAPPLPEGRLSVVRADGGASARANAVRMVVIGGCIVALLSATLVAGGLYFLRTLRRERLDALRKTAFLDNVSHELKTPLAGIRLNAELLEQGRIADEKMRRGALEAILVESDRLAKMVDDLLDFSRLEKGSFRFKMETFDLGEFAMQPSEQQGVAAISHGRATVRVAGETGRGAQVRADKNAIRQIGVNLVTNAVKYTAGPIDVEVEGNEIRYMDRGPGLAPGDEERVFERFYRADNSLTRSVGGSGLGLAIARALARGMGGDLTYSRRNGGGSVFTLKLS